MTSRRHAAVAVAVCDVALLLAATRPWLSGRSADPVLAGATVVATGSQAAPAALALAAVCGAALLATLTAGPRMRVAATVVLVGSALGALGAVARVLADPAGALAARAAEQAGRTGMVAVQAGTTAWVWFALGCAVLLVLSCAWLAVAQRGAEGLSRRFDRPAGPPSEGAPPARSSWDALSEGDDPTQQPAGGG